MKNELIEELETDLEVLIYNNSFNIYSKKEYKKEYKRILKELRKLENEI